MSRGLIFLSLLLACALAVPDITLAQPAPPVRAKPKAAAPARPAPTAAARRPAPEPALVLPLAGGEQLAAAAMVHFGEHRCEFDQMLTVTLNPQHDGYLDIRTGAQRFVARPVLSSTGALRLEDVSGRMLLLQIAFKSMLMDVRSGRRVADECVHEKHLEARRAAESAPPQPGLGIDPTRAAVPPPAAASAAAPSPAAPASSP